MNSSYFPNSSNITHVVLNNGIKILVYENFTAQSVVIAGTLFAGSVYDVSSQKGLASLTANLLMRGTERYSFDAIYTQLEDIGADLELYAGIHKAGFVGKSLAEDLPILLDVLAEVLLRPTFPDDEFKRVMGEHRTWLKYQNQDTRHRAEDAFHKLLYPKSHPYHYPTRGTLKTIENITVDDLKQFYSSYYSPENMIITVVGAVKALQVVDSITACFADWSPPLRNNLLPTLDDFSPASFIRHQENVAGKTQADIMLGMAGPSRFSEDYQAANLANGILGQFGMMGRLGDLIREELGLAYYVYSRLDGGFGPSPWYVAAGVDPLDVDNVVALILQEVEKMRSSTIDDYELDNVKAYFIGRLPLQLENNEGICTTIMTLESYHLGLDYLLEYPDMISKVTLSDVYHVMSHYWNRDHLVVSIAGPESNSE